MPGKSRGQRSLVGCRPWSRKESDTTERLHFHFHALEKEMATHSSILAWRIPGTGEPGGLPSLGSHRVGHDWSDLAAAAALFNNHENPIIESRELIGQVISLKATLLVSGEAEIWTYRMPEFFLIVIKWSIIVRGWCLSTYKWNMKLFRKE